MSGDHDVVERLLDEIEYLRALVIRLSGARDELPGYAKGYADGLARRPADQGGVDTKVVELAGRIASRIRPDFA